ncbi:MAG: hypothetical protein E6K70_12635 [Planctomycetota bacterium]|nr:MAG: hypothetical protein E6K70_12635 [Planctomycetota bacterium]
MPTSQTSSAAQKQTWSRLSAGGSSTRYATWDTWAGIDAAVAPGDDPLVDDEPALARTMVASVQ